MAEVSRCAFHHLHGRKNGAVNSQFIRFFHVDFFLLVFLTTLGDRFS